MSSTARYSVVLGLGNILHSDDGAGPRALELLRGDCRLPKDVVLIDGGTSGLELLPELWDCAYLLVLDAVDVQHSPGTVVRSLGEELCKLRSSSNVHQVSLADLLIALRLLARQPPEVVLLGIQPETVRWGTEMSAPVQSRLRSLAEAAIAELGRKPMAST
jgi:hydrogenase maturation protease